MDNESNKLSSRFMATQFPVILNEANQSTFKIFTGIPEIDNSTEGLSTGVHVIAGFTKCCKSTLALNIAYRALNDGINVCILSLEMTKKEIMDILISRHTFEVGDSEQLTRKEVSEMSRKDVPKYRHYYNQVMSLGGELIIYTEKDLEEYGLVYCAKQPWHTEEVLDKLLYNVNDDFKEYTGKPMQLLIVDNINCIRTWDKNLKGETAYSQISNYFRKVSKNIDGSGSQVVCLLLSQINRNGGQRAKELGFYPESSIAETVNIERDATNIILIYVYSYFDNDQNIKIKLEKSRFCPSMAEAVEVESQLEYAFIGTPLDELKIDNNKLKYLEENTETVDEYWNARFTSYED